MREKLDKIIVVDIESTCWEQNEKPKNEVSEIIEVGISVISSNNLQIESKESIIVKPSRSRISKYCTNLTTLTQEQVDKGVSFNEACEILRNKYNSKKLTWSSWGSYDRKMFESQCRDMCIDYPYSKNHINIKNVFAVLYGLPKELNAPSALNHINMNFEGTLHRGDDDSYNIAKVFIHLMKKFRNVG